jgi:hypothetical protein
MNTNKNISNKAWAITLVQNKVWQKWFFTILFVLVFTTISSVTTSCQEPSTSFGDILISDSVQEDTNKPQNPKNEFDVNAKEIFATMQYFGVKGGSQWKFRWINKDTDNVILESSDYYNADRPDSFYHGIVLSSIKSSDETKIIPPGNYTVEFYNDSSLKKTAEFKIIKPGVEILSVEIAGSVDETGKPAGAADTLTLKDTVFACVKLNYLVTGTNIKAVFKDSVNEIIGEDEKVISSDYYSPAYVNLSMDFNTAGIELKPGKYEVEIFLNGIPHSSASFDIEEAPLVSFNQGLNYKNDDFKFSINIPDYWSYEENRPENSLSVKLIPEKETTAEFMFLVLPAEQIKPFEKYTESSTQSMADKNNWQLTDSRQNIYNLKNTYPTTEIIYLFQDSAKSNYITVYSITEYKGLAYIFSVVASDLQDDNFAEQVYIAVINSLTFY